MTPADLRAARKRLGLTQKALATALRMGAHGWQSISAWESDNDPRQVPGPVVVAIECLLNHSPRLKPNGQDREAGLECEAPKAGSAPS